MNLFSLYIFIEIGGTGGGCFRYMFSRFLKEASKITENKLIGKTADVFNQAGKKFSEIGLMFKEAETMSDLDNKIEIASRKFAELANLEEEGYRILKDV